MVENTFLPSHADRQRPVHSETARTIPWAALPYYAQAFGCKALRVLNGYYLCDNDVLIAAKFNRPLRGLAHVVFHFPAVKNGGLLSSSRVAGLQQHQRSCLPPASCGRYCRSISHPNA